MSGHGSEPPDHESRLEHLEEQFDELLEAAVEAEQETAFETVGRVETEEQARRHLLVRVIRVTVGLIVFCVGITLVVLPGPGLLVMAAGLALMARDLPFARRWLTLVRERIPEGEDGNVAVWVIVLSVVGFVLSVGGSLWWTFGR